MTCIIGAICDGGNTVVTVSDRLVSDPVSWMVSEPDTPKIVGLGKSIVALVSGNLLASYVLAGVPGDRVQVVAQEVRKALNQETASQIASKVLLPNLGCADFGAWLNQQSMMSPHLVAKIATEINNWRFHVTYIIAGVDDRGAHLWTVSDEIPDGCYDTIGYCCQGVSAPLAANTFGLKNYGPTWGYDDAVRVAMRAKRITERTRLVGRKTDIRKITREGVAIVTE
jgi:20S proteasome alpha/beta subunit